MKMRNRIILAILGILAVLFVELRAAVFIFGKNIVVTQIEKNLKMKAKVKAVRLGFPLSVTLTGFELGNLAAIDKVSIHPSLLGFLAGRIVLNDLTLVHPVITLEQSPDGKLNLPPVELKKGSPPPVLLTGLLVKDGVLSFRDKKVSPQGYELMLDAINIDIAKVAMPPTSLNTKFKISARLADAKNKSAGTLASSGWIDFGPKDMDGMLEIQNVEVTAFAPYYGNFISAKKLISAKLKFTSDMKASNNELTALCHLELRDMVYEQEPPAEGGQPTPDIFPSALDFFADNQGAINLDFYIRTKLDHPELGTKALQKAAMNAALKNLSNKTPIKVQGNINDIIDQFKKFKDGYKDMFKKKEEAQQQQEPAAQ